MTFAHVFLAVCVVQVASAQSLKSFPASVTVHVIDEEGVPVENADASVTFTNFDIVKTRLTYTARRALTNNEGKVTATAEALDNRVFYGAEKAGYYKTTGLQYEFKEKKEGRWQPWNPTVEVVLKRLVNPIPMYAKRVNLAMPVFGKPIGFDLGVGDWVVPQGKGISTDIIFTATLEQRSELDFDYNLTVSFPNELDGIQTFAAEPANRGSVLRSPRVAPENGYEKQVVRTRTRRPGHAEQANDDPKRAYFFRTRTVVDEKGKILSANYGKIYGDFMAFTYYLNPTHNDRNVEFDPKKNMFTAVWGSELVSDP